MKAGPKWRTVAPAVLLLVLALALWPAWFRAGQLLPWLQQWTLCG